MTNEHNDESINNGDTGTSVVLAPVQQKEPQFPEEMPILILTNQVVFPAAVVPLRITAPNERKLIDDIVMKHRLTGLLSGRNESDGLDGAPEIGAIGQVLQLQRLPDGTMNVLFQAIMRFRVKGLVQREPYLIARIQPLPTESGDAEVLAPLMQAVRIQMTALIQVSPNIPDSAVTVLDSIEDPGFLADLVAVNLNIGLDQKQKLLETLDPKKRLEQLLFLLTREVEVMQIAAKIQQEVKESIEDNQREFYLRQQLKAIQAELGESGAERPELKAYRDKLEALDLKSDVLKEVKRELERLERMNEASAEYHVLTTYLDWVLELPWNKTTEDQLDLDSAETILEEDHYGLMKVKKRILEYLAVRKLKPDAPGPILCFVGPPGVGKTSLGKSIARAMGRSFVRMSLGGMRDEAEIRGHRKTYVGAMPGRIIQSIRKAGSNNPVFMLDEIDKVGMDFRGDPSSALLEVLDPAQNDSFTDLYLSVPFDLSKVMFIATANVLDTIPWALRDRMEVIEIPGYTIQEKLEIGKRYLLPRQITAHGLSSKKAHIGMPVLRALINDYTQEAGVRNLEREIANICRVAAEKIARGKAEKVSIKPEHLHDYLGNPKVHLQVAERASIPGISTGLAWTPSGGDILFIEATRMPGKGNLLLTGQLGEVMKESAQTVLSYVRAHSDDLGISNEFFSENDIHIHVPAGAVPKDGPSAGTAMLTAVVSLLTGKKVKNLLAMTGEITLRGLVLPVGGIKVKVLAAHRAGIREIILPEKCQNDLEDVPESAKSKLKFHFVTRMAEVLDIALGVQC